MRAILVSDCYGPRVGGIESQVGDLAHHLRGRGVDVEVLTLTPDASGRAGGLVEVEERGNGPVRVRRLGHPGPAGLLVDPSTRPALRDLLQPQDDTVVHAQLGVISPFAADAVRAALEAGTPVVATWHSHLHRAAPWWRASGVLRRWADRGLLLTAVSSVAAEELSRAAGGAPVTVLPNGIDTAVFRPGRDRPVRDRAEHGRPGRGRLGAGQSAGLQVVTTMRLVPLKRPGALLRVLARARRRLGPGHPLHLTILGDGPLRSVLELETRVLGLHDVVTFAGRVPRDQVAATVASADVFLSSARREAFGIAALEARALGVPVLALADSGVRDIVTTGQDGLLAPDDDGLVDALCALAERPGLLERWAATARSTPPPHTWPLVCDAVLATYTAALAGGRGTIRR